MASSSPANASGHPDHFIVFNDIPDLGLFIGDVIQKTTSFDDYVVLNRDINTETNEKIRPPIKKGTEIVLKIPPIKYAQHQGSLKEVHDKYTDDDIVYINGFYHINLKNHDTLRKMLCNYINKSKDQNSANGESSVCAIAGGRRRATARRKHPRHKSRRRATTRKHSRK